MKSFVAFGLLFIAVVHAAHFAVPLNNLRITRSAQYNPYLGGGGFSGSNSGSQATANSQSFNSGIGSPFGGLGLSGSASSASANSNSQSFNNGYNNGYNGFGGLPFGFAG